MAKTSVIYRAIKREKLIAKYAEKRAQLKEIIRDPNINYEERETAMHALQKLPRNSSAVRKRNRCKITGRPRGVYRKFGLSRSMLRIHAMKGNIPGLVKSSW